MRDFENNLSKSQGSLVSLAPLPAMHKGSEVMGPTPQALVFPLFLINFSLLARTVILLDTLPKVQKIKSFPTGEM